MDIPTLERVVEFFSPEIKAIHGLWGWDKTDLNIVHRGMVRLVSENGWHWLKDNRQRLIDEIEFVMSM